MARESFLLRTDPRVLDALRRWADDELRSVNGQIDYLLRQALLRNGRLRALEDQKQGSRKKDERPIQGTGSDPPPRDG